MSLVLAHVLSAALRGVEAALVRVEVDVTAGLPAFTTVGLPDSAVRESRERVAAISSNRHDSPDRSGCVPRAAASTANSPRFIAASAQPSPPPENIA